MKKYLDAILVVEGKEDAAFLSNYIASEIVTINGYEMPNTTISYLKDKRVIVLTDPDEAGRIIRTRLNELLKNAINVEIDINKCCKGKKKGVAECQIDEILAKLKPYFIDKERHENTINSSLLYELGILGNKELRKFVCKRLNLGDCNNKQMIKRINYQQITIETLKSIVKEYNNGN